MRSTGSLVAMAVAAAIAALLVIQAVRKEPAGAAGPSSSSDNSASQTAPRRDGIVTAREPSRRAGRSIVFESGSLSLQLREQRLGPVLGEIARKSGVSIFSSPEVDQRIVSAQVDALPLDQALRRLLAECDSFFYFSAHAQGAGALRTVWVYPKDGGAELVPVPPESWASTQDFERKLASSSAAERILAIETIVSREGAGALDTAMRGLGDGSAEVRLRALDVALSAGVPLPSETLAALTNDASGDVRALALEAIASATEPGSPREAETEQLLRRMLGDADEQVRARAQELLDARHGA